MTESLVYLYISGGIAKIDFWVQIHKQFLLYNDKNDNDSLDSTPLGNCTFYDASYTHPLF